MSILIRRVEKTNVDPEIKLATWII